MSFERQFARIINKARDIEKQAMLLDKDAVIEMCSCKRNIMRKNNPEAIKNARRCIQLNDKCSYLMELSTRIKNFVECINQEKHKKDFKPLVATIDRCLKNMNYDLLELHLESFELNSQKIHANGGKPNYKSCLIMCRVIPKPEIDNLLVKLAEEANQDEIYFLYKTPPQSNSQIVQEDKIKQNEEELSKGSSVFFLFRKTSNT